MSVDALKKQRPEWFSGTAGGSVGDMSAIGAAVKYMTANKGHITANISALSECKSAQEQKELLLAMLGDLSGVQPLGHRVLTATYVASEVSKGGIIMTDKRKEAARFEGKVGLVVAMGPDAFKFFDRNGDPLDVLAPKVGDWVWYRASDGAERFLRNVSVRAVDDQCIEGITDDPEAIY